MSVSFRFAGRLATALCTSALAFAFAGCPGGTTTGPDDCEDGQVEHPYTGECVDDCSTDETVCTGATPVCIGGGGADGGTGDGDSIFAGLCGCDENSCGAGEVCNPIAGVCVSPCDPFEDGSAGDAGQDLDCPEIDGEAWACFNHPDADDYVCQPPCAVNDDCIDADYPVCDDGFCVAYCDSTDELRLDCPNNDCNVSTGLCGGPAACMDNDDCGAQICDIATGECVGCEENADCGAQICDLASGDCVGCEAQADCGDGFDCDLGTGECFAVCAGNGEDELCEDDEVCVEGDPVNFCEALCDDIDCIEDDAAGEQLCQFDVEDADFNLCVDPDLATATCLGGLAHTGRDAGGPIIQYVEYLMTGGACGNDGLIVFYNARLWAPGGIPGSLYTAGITYLNDTADGDLTYSDGPGTPTHPSATEVMGMADYYDLAFTLCEPKDDEALAVYLTDAAGNDSNAICFGSGEFTE
jgi:hypothetical protein